VITDVGGDKGFRAFYLQLFRISAHQRVVTLLHDVSMLRLIRQSKSLPSYLSPHCSVRCCRPLSSLRKRQAIRSSEDIARRLDHAQVNRALLTVKRALKARTPQRSSLITATVQNIFNSNSFSTNSREIAFRKFTSILLRHHCWDDALSLFLRMKSENITPSPQLHSKVAAVIIFRNALDAEDPIQLFAHSFTRPEVDDACFRQLIKVLTHDSYDIEIVEIISNLYIQSRPPDWEPTLDFAVVFGEFHARVLDMPRNLEGKIQERGKEVPKLSQDHAASIYGAVMKDCGRNDNMTPADILNRMQELQIPFNADAMNTIIRLEARSFRFNRSFLFYRLLVENRSRTFLPDARTYGLLFQISGRIFGLHRQRSRNYRRTENALTPLSLFRDMVECDLIQTLGQLRNNSTVMDLHALNDALEAFLRQQDYAAAFVAVRTLAHCGLKPNLRTYKVLFKHLVARVKWGLCSSKEGQWIKRLLAVGNPGAGTGWTLSSPTDQIDPDMSLDDHIMTRLVWLASGTNFRMKSMEDQMRFLLDPYGLLYRWFVSPRRFRHTRSLHFRIPTLSLLTREPALFGAPLPDEAGHTFDVLPLLKTLRRAMKSVTSAESVRQAKAKMVVFPSQLRFPRGNLDNRKMIDTGPINWTS
jgi:pentatricopeptide repeat protein